MASNIFVTGAIRSGTTFIGRALSTSPHSIYIHEPFNPDSPWNAAIPTPISSFYIADHNQGVYNPRFSQLLKLKPNIRGKWQDHVREDRMRYINNWLPIGFDATQINKIIKDPIGLFCTEWLVKHWKMKPVIVVRDPRDVIKSIFRLSWHKNFNNNWLEMQPELHERLLKMEEALDISDHITNNTCDNDLLKVIHYLKPSYVALLFFTKVLDYHMVCYERLTSDPESEFKNLFHSLNLTLTGEFEVSLKNKENSFDSSKAHQNTVNPVSSTRIRELHKNSDFSDLIDDDIIIEAFSDFRKGFDNSVDWWA